MRMRGSICRGHLSERYRRRASAMFNSSSTSVCSTATRLRSRALSLFLFDGDANADLNHTVPWTVFFGRPRARFGIRRHHCRCVLSHPSRTRAGELWLGALPRVYHPAHLRNTNRVSSRRYPRSTRASGRHVRRLVQESGRAPWSCDAGLGTSVSLVSYAFSGASRVGAVPSRSARTVAPTNLVASGGTFPRSWCIVCVTRSEHARPDTQRSPSSPRK